METLSIKDDYIKLGQALKLLNWVSSGVEAKDVIADGLVTVGGEVEVRRGRKLYDGAIIKFEEQSAKITK